MKYKPSDKVRIKSIDWYNENKNENGYIDCGNAQFIPTMSTYCGEVLTICGIEEEFSYYHMKECQYVFMDEMIEELVEESVSIDVAVEETIKDISDKVVDTLMGGLMVGKSFNLPEGYVFKDENGNVINTHKIVLEKKKKEYPKTYEECCNVLSLGEDGRLYTKGYKASLIQDFQKLLICRDAYWKIAGEEMGLGKPWKPDYTEKTVKYCLRTNYGRIVQTRTSHDNHPFSFPTEEMRDAFYENFKEEIEICKELL